MKQDEATESVFLGKMQRFKLLLQSAARAA